MFNVNTVNTEAQTDGVWVELLGASWLVAATGTTKYTKKMEALRKPYQKAIDAKKLDPEVATDLYCKALGSTVLIGWDKEVAEEVDGVMTPIKYSPENAASILKKNPDLMELIIEFGNDLENYRHTEVKATVKK